MNERLKLKVSKTYGIEIENSGIVIYVANASAQAINETTNMQPLNIGDRDIAREKDLTTFHIVCNKDKANKLYYLILLKNILKNSVADELGEWNIIIKNIKQIDLKWGRDNMINIYRNHLYLSNGDLLDEKNDLVINPVNVTTNTPINQANPLNNLDNYKNQLFTLTDLLTKLEDFFVKGGDFDLSLYTSLENDIIELQSYVNNAGPGVKGADAKQTIYNIVETKTIPEQLLKIKIDNWIDKLKEYRVWYQIIGLKTDTEIKAVKANGFTILGKAGSAPTIGTAINSSSLDLDNLNVTEIKKNFPSPNGKYKEFLINVPSVNHKILIDLFRDFRFFGSVINNIAYPQETEPNKCRGFKPNDFRSSGPVATYAGQTESMIDNNGQIVETGIDSFLYSKMAIDAWTAPNIDKAIDLLFFGIPYENMIGKNGDRYNVDNAKCLLYFNEIEENGVTKSKILKGYYNALKHHKCGSKANLGTADWTASNYSNDLVGATGGPRKKVEENYQIIKEFIEIFEKDYSSYQSDKINELNEDRTKLLNYLFPATTQSNPAYKKIKNHWKIKLISKSNEIGAKISTLSNTPAPEPDNPLYLLIEKELGVEIDKIEGEKDKRTAMKNSIKDSNAHHWYETIEIMKKFAEVKDATKKDATTLTELKKLKTDKTNGWAIINKYKHTDGSGYADYRLKLYEDTEEEPKTLEEKQIEFLAKIWDEDFVDETSFKAKIDSADENVINDTEKEKLKNELVPRKKLTKKLESKDDEAKKLIDLLKFFRPDYSGKNLKNENKKTQLEKQLKDLEEYTKSGTIQNGVFNNDLEDPEKEVVTNLIKEIKTKVAEMRKAQEEQPPKTPPSSDTPWTSILIVASIVLGLVGLIVYFGQRRKDSEESEEVE